METRRRHIAAWIGLLVTVAAIGVIDMPALILPADPVHWREEAQSIVRDGALALNPAKVAALGGAAHPYVHNPRNNKWYSKYGVMNSLMSLPPVLLQQMFDGGSPHAAWQSDLLALNFWNVALSVALAAALMRLAGMYTSRLATRIIFVLTCLYATFLWFYLRAQSSEIWQVLFFTCAFLCLVKFLRGRCVRWSDLGCAWIFVGTLVLTRISYLILLPLVLGFVVMELWRIRKEPNLTVRRAVWLWLLIPPIVIVATLGWVNYVKFGSPLLSGYHQANPELHWPTGRLWDGVWGFLFLPRFSVLLYFPLVGFSLLALPEFFRRHRADAVVAVGTFVAFLCMLGKVPTWAGEWTYGPRYLLFALPALSLPFIIFIDNLLDRRRRRQTWALAAVAIAALAHSSWLQFRVNSVDFYTYDYVRVPIERYWNDPVAGYFRDHHVGTIVNELLAHRDEPDSLAWFAQLHASGVPEPFLREYRQTLAALTHISNRYWWRE